MEFRREYGGSDEEEALSLCDLVTDEERLCDSNPESADWEDFDFAFDRSGSTANHSCPADVLFHDGRILPLAGRRPRSEFGTQISDGIWDPRGENGRHLKEKLQAWRINSSDSQSSCWTSASSSTNSRGSRRKSFTDENFRPGYAAVAGGKSKPGKASLKWRILTLGLLKTPSMELDELRLRHAKSGNNGVENSNPVFKQSCEGFKKAKAGDFQLKSKAEVVTFTSCRMQLAYLTSFKGCKVSADSVVKCSTAKTRALAKK